MSKKTITTLLVILVFLIVVYIGLAFLKTREVLAPETERTEQTEQAVPFWGPTSPPMIEIPVGD